MRSFGIFAMIILMVFGCVSCGNGKTDIASLMLEICDACGGELVIRKDDDPETVKNRLKVFHAETEALKGYYSKFGCLRMVDGDRPIDEVTATILRVIEVNA